MRTFVEVLRDNAVYREHSHVFVRMDGSEREISFPELWGLACQRAHKLHEMGLKKGDRVAIILPETDSFVLTFIGFNGTFFPMHLLGIAGMPRRYADPYLHPWMQDLQPMNEFMTYCAILMGMAQFLLLGNFLISIFNGEKCGRNPWGANGLEWSAPSPPGHGNFDVPPVCYRGPYEYSGPEAEALDQDFILQTTPPPDVPAEESPATA